MVKALSAGDYSTCALVRPSIVECWGDDGYGQLGNGDKVGALAPVNVHLGRPATAVAAGGSHACALLDNGTIDCWGANVHGELGNGSRTDSPTPVPVPGIRDASAVAAGVAHTCALLKTGSVECWGANGDGQLGNGTTADSANPVAVTGLVSSARAIAAGLAHTCAALDDGGIDCWGANANGELGNGTTVDSSVPLLVTGLAGHAAAIDAGDAHTCALLDGGRVQCWGWNIEGQLGNGGGSDSAAPLDVAGLGAATAIAAGGSHTCALLRKGAVDCWGANLYGQLGNGTTSDSAAPVGVSGLQNGVAAITAGLYHSCAILQGGSATCWGWNQQGQLGNRSTTSSSSPVGVAGLGLAADGTGAITASPRSVSSSSRHVTIAFTYTVAAGGIHNGALALTVPLGWSIPSIAPKAPGDSSATVGRTTVEGRTIDVTDLTLPAGGTVTIVYGATNGGGPGAQPHTAGAAIWTVREQSSASGNLSVLRDSPLIHVLSADGSGILATRSSKVASGATGQTLTFDFAPAPGGVDDGTLTLTVPPGWSPPSTRPGAPGYVHASQGSVAVVGNTITVIGITLAGAQRLQIVYERAHAPATAVGSQTWNASLRSSPAGSLVAMSASPQVNVLAPDGSGEASVSQSTVANGARGVRLTFAYTADNGGVDHGALTLTVPPGWSEPSASNVSSPAPGVGISGRTITVPLTSSSVQLTYVAATAPTTNVGSQEWTVRERSTAGGHLRPLASEPSVTVLSRDGSGRLLRASGSTAPGSASNTVVFVYEAGPGGLQDGTLELDVPGGWSAPSVKGGDAGYTIATTGSLSVSGQTITISHVTLASGATLSVVYGSRTGGGAGARAPKRVGPRVWRAAEASTSNGKLQTLR